MGRVLVGTSGFQYRHWRETFYPEGLAQNRWLDYYAERFMTVELNVTFYRLPTPATFRKWRERTPDDFVFALKGSRFITHIKRLRDPEEPLARFMEGAALLREKAGIVLWQFPPNFSKDTDRLDRFVGALGQYPVRQAFEFRNVSWIEKDVEDILRSGGHVFCSADWPPFLADPPRTGGFAYIRRHGRGGIYDTLYSREELAEDANRIRRQLMGRRDVFIYFNNDSRGYAPRNAAELRELLGR
jgi:uncharacterized protein YecE (DUF72 family)